MSDVEPDTLVEAWRRERLDVDIEAGRAVLEASRKIKEKLYGAVSARYNLNVIYDFECKDGRIQAIGKPEYGLSFGEAVALVQKAGRGVPLAAKGSYTPRSKGLVSPAFSSPICGSLWKHGTSTL